MGYRIVDTILAHHQRLDQLQAGNLASGEQLRQLLAEPLPEEGQDLEMVFSDACDKVFNHMMYSNHPRFMGFIPSPSNPVSALLEALVAGFNPFMGAWHEACGPTTAEIVLIDWLRNLAGLPETAAGMVVSGGSAANLTALTVARHHQLGRTPAGGVIYFSDQTHCSLKKDLRVLGFKPEQMRELPSRGGRLDLSALQESLEKDRTEGCQPFCIIANAGTTNTGAIDPLDELADLSQSHGLWLHVDGAYGAGALLCPEGRALLAGIQRADSLSLDAHKWLFQPFEAGCIMVRRGQLLKEAFYARPDYMEDLDGGFNFSDHGLQLSRSFKAFKLWFTLKLFGRKTFAQAIEHGLEMARFAQHYLETSSRFQVVTPASLGIVTFRHPDLDDEQHGQLVQTSWQDGYAVISSTRVEGQTVLRLCPIHPGLDQQQLKTTIVWLEKLASQETNPGMG
ncbi:MAG: aspartate aminotransferase family protein [Vulcanimicrobiota bacterium]